MLQRCTRTHGQSVRLVRDAALWLGVLLVAVKAFYLGPRRASTLTPQIRAVAARNFLRGRPVRDRPVERRPPCSHRRHLTPSRMADLDRLRGRCVPRAVCGGRQRRRVRCAGRLSHLSTAPDGWQRAHGPVLGERTHDAVGDRRARWRAGRVPPWRLAGAALGSVRGAEPRLRQGHRGGRDRMDSQRTSRVWGALGDAAGSSHRRTRTGCWCRHGGSTVPLTACGCRTSSRLPT